MVVSRLRACAGLSTSDSHNFDGLKVAETYEAFAFPRLDESLTQQNVVGEAKNHIVENRPSNSKLNAARLAPSRHTEKLGAHRAPRCGSWHDWLDGDKVNLRCGDGFDGV
jgi:hypothetical protein